MSAERRLGRGLEALLGRPSSGQAAAGMTPVEGHPDVVFPDHTLLPDHTALPGHTALPDQPVDGDVLQIGVHDIDSNPYQPRTQFDEQEIANLAESIKRHGLLQPIVVRRVGQRYQLISGERRWRASMRVGMPRISATLRVVDDRQVAEMTIVENLQRSDLGPLEKAVSFQDYLRRYQCTQEELAGRLSIDRSTIANLIRLLELPEAVQMALRDGTISAGHARALLPLGDEREQIAFCDRIGREKLSVRATEQQVSEMIRSADREPLQIVGGPNSAPRQDARRRDNLGALEQELRAALGTRVDLQQTAKGRGRITVHFTSPAEFDRLRVLLNGRDASQVRAG